MKNNFVFIDELRSVLQHAGSTTTEFSFILKPSSVSGVGVFATHHIAEGTFLRLFPAEEYRLIPYEDADKDPVLKEFCARYGVEFEEGISIPQDFGCMNIGSYLNHSENPNAYHNEQYEYFAKRDIAPGEEITIDYRLL